MMAQLISFTILIFQYHFQAKVTPQIGTSAFGALGISIYVFKAELLLRAYICTTAFPTKAEIKFGKFPLDIK